MIPQIETPKANPENLVNLIEQAYHGKLVLPEFQRAFVWTRENIEELLVSILQGYFIGTFLILDTPPERALFPFRLVEGRDKLHPPAGADKHGTVRIVLDGQQRITSLFYVLHEPPIPLRNSRNPYQFFLRLDLILDGNPDDAVYGISLADRRRLAEMQRFVDEGKAIRFSLFRDSSAFYQWLYRGNTALGPQEKEIVERFYRRFSQFLVPVVSISPEAGKENIVNIFERINRTGVSLSLFDLAAARLYPKGIRLRRLWETLRRDNPALASVLKPEFVLKVIAIWQKKEPRKSSLLDVVDELDKDEFERQWGKACEWLRRAYERVTSPEVYGAFDTRWIPYTTMLVPLAVLLEFVHQAKGGEAAYRQVDRWYWGSVFTQRYDQAVDTTTLRDVRSVQDWFHGAARPSWLDGFQIESIELSDIQDRRSSIYRGVMSLIVRAGARDFLDGQPAVLSECQDDHVFPKSKFHDQRFIHSILNRTLISSRSNQVKLNKRPSEYLSELLAKHGGDQERLRATLRSHLIFDDAVAAMERDDFDAFLEARNKAIWAEINRHVRGEP